MIKKAFLLPSNDPSDSAEYKKIGKATTNHASLEPKRKTLPRLR